MLVIPVQSGAQGRVPASERALPEMIAAAVSSSSVDVSQSAAARSGGRDSLLNGTVIGLAVGAALGMALVYATRDSELGAEQYAYGALIFGGIGAGVGVGVDALLDRSSSVVGRSPRRDALNPRVSPKRAGLRVVIRW